MFLYFGVYTLNSEMKLQGFKERLSLLIGAEQPFAWASRIGIPGATFNRMWNDGTAPKADHLATISKATGCSIDWLLTGEGDMKRGDKPSVHDAAPGWTPSNGHPASKSVPPDGPEGYSDYELRFVLLRDIIETYEDMRPGREPERKAREITIIYRHFMEHFARHLDEVEISEYINTWM